MNLSESSDTVTLRGRIRVPYKWTVGETGSRFFVALRDEGRLLATKCAGCEAVYLPPRKWCPDCFVDCDSWVEVALEGAVVDWTVVRKAGQLAPFPVPFSYATIKLDGATTALLAVITGDVDTLTERQRVRAVLKDDRTGDMADISHFEMVASG